jgi:tetratricopeptide (TPR) repeat protein
MITNDLTLEELRAAFESDPQNLDKAMQLAQMYCDLGWFNEAIEFYKELSQSNPDSYSLILEYGNTCYKKKDMKGAIDLFQRLTELRADRIEGWNNLGIVQLQNGDQEAAKVSIGKVLDLEPENSGALLNMGNYFSGKAEYETAESFFERAVESKMDFPDAWYNLGNTYLALNEFEKAKNAFEKAIKYQSEFPSALKNLGFIYEKSGDFETALAFYNQASSLNKADAGLHVNLGNIYLQQKKYEESRKCYLKAVRLAPNGLAGWMGLRHLSLVKGDLNTFMHATLAILPRLSDGALAQSIEVFYELNQLSKADDLLMQADRLGRSGNELDLQRLLIYHRKGIHQGKVVGIYKKLSALADKTESIKKGLARYALETGQNEIAIQYIKEMNKPESAGYSILWRALLAMKETDQARESIQNYIRDNPDTFECWFLLARIEAERGFISKAEKYLIRALENGFTNLEELNDCSELKRIFDSLAAKDHLIEN